MESAGAARVAGSDRGLLEFACNAACISLHFGNTHDGAATYYVSSLP
jgi:hypothetical protein